jgi:superfamily II DNA or RNA helicase
MSELFQQGFWDGKKCLLKKTRNAHEGRFPAGILQHVVTRLQAQNFQRVHIEDTRVYPNRPMEVDPTSVSFEMREYQVEGSGIALASRRGVLRLPTGAGKTKTLIGILAALDLPTLWITHEGALARQTRKNIEMGVSPNREVGMFSGEEKTIKRWTVGLVQSLHRRRDQLAWWFKQIQVLVLDECHHGAADTWYETAMAIPAAYRFGASATPFERSDKSTLELMGCCGDVIYEREAEEVRGFLSRPHVEMIHTPRKPIIASAWPDVYRLGIVENAVRNVHIVERSMRSVTEKTACIVFVSSIDHGRKIYDALSESIGVNGFHEFMNGDTPQSVRDTYYARLRSGDLLILIATDGVAGEGQDIPAVRRVVIGGGLKAAIIVKQRIGRGMRPTDIGQHEDGWGGEVHIHDFVDNHHPKLLQHSDQRRGHYAAVSAIITENYDATTTRG